MLESKLIKTFVVTLILISIASASEKRGVGGSMHIEPVYLSIRGQDPYSSSNFRMTPAIRMPIVDSKGFSIETEFSIWHSIQEYDTENWTNEVGVKINNAKDVWGIYTLNVYFKFTKELNSMLLYPGIRCGLQYTEIKSERSLENNEDYTEINADRNQVLGLLYGGE
ncbi:MAG: hypothetical protein K9M80_01260, partial [Candidatus Marinimicrobia bacterium]|nr:hypothetical protein [Candidatus Neomarinimicrobiota bacterium]